MKVPFSAVGSFLFLFGLDRNNQLGTKTTSSSVSKLYISSSSITTQQQELRNTKAQELKNAIAQVGQVGSLASEQDQEHVKNIALELSQYSDPNPAKVPLSGLHTLLYSSAPGGSSGKLFGNVYGKVTQEFPTSDNDGGLFYNAVEIGPVKLQLTGRRNVKNDHIIKVSFLKTAIALFDNIVFEKVISGGGVWDYKFIGVIQDEQSGKDKLLRVMETPSLFVIEHDLN